MKSGCTVSGTTPSAGHTTTERSSSPDLLAGGPPPLWKPASHLPRPPNHGSSGADVAIKLCNDSQTSTDAPATVLANVKVLQFSSRLENPLIPLRRKGNSQRTPPGCRIDTTVPLDGVLLAWHYKTLSALPQSSHTLTFLSTQLHILVPVLPLRRSSTVIDQFVHTGAD